MRLTKLFFALILLAVAFPVIVPQAIIVPPMAYAGELQFFVLQGPWTPERGRYELWASKGSNSLNQLDLPKGQYLLGVSRKIDQQDAPFIDRTYSYPSPFGKGTDQEIISEEKDGIPVDFNPVSTTATITVKDGIMCWNWQHGIVIVPRLGQKGVIAHLLV